MFAMMNVAKISRISLTASALAAFTFATNANADDYRIGGNFNFGQWARPGCEQPLPAPQEQVCEDRPRQVWREPIYETREVLVTIPARTESRIVPEFSPGGRFVAYKRVQVVVEPARQMWRTERVLVRPGGYETTFDRVCLAQPFDNGAFDASPGYDPNVANGWGYARPQIHKARAMWNTAPVHAEPVRDTSWNIGLGFGYAND